MDERDAEARIDALIAEGNYIGAYGRVRRMSDSDDAKAELTGRIANAIASELQSARSQGSERQAYLRAQLAWVCRDVPGLSYLYREQVRQRPADIGGDLLKSIRDIAEGRPADAADRVRRDIEGVQESIASGEAADKVQGFLKEAGRAVGEGVKRVGDLLDSVTRRGESIRLEREGRGKKPEAAADAEVRMRIEGEDGPGTDGEKGSGG